jgi:PAS domain S-box-containing protein
MAGRTYNAPEWKVTDVDGGPFPDEALPFRRVMDAGEPVRDVVHAIEWPDGQRVLLSINAAPLADEAGQVDGMVASVEDITTRVRARAALRESEARFRSLYDTMTELVVLHEIVYDPGGRPVDYRIVDCNLAFTQITGIPRDVAIGALASELYAAGEPPYLEIYARVAETGAPAQFETFFPPMDKHLSISAVSSHKGTFFTIASDITERVRTEEALRASQKFLDTVLNSVAATVFTVTIPGWRIELVNQAVRSVFGYEPEEVIGKSTRMLYPDEAGFLKFGQAMEAALAAGQERFQQEQQLVRKDGRTLWSDAYSTVVRSGDAFTHVVSVVYDITARVKAQEALRALSARQEALLAAIPEIIMEVDERKVYTWANEAGYEFFGPDVLGKEAAFYFEGEQDTYRIVQPLFDGTDQTIYVESWQRRKDGQKRLLGWWCRSLQDAEGRITGTLSTARDITESRRAEELIRDLAKFPAENPSPVLRIGHDGEVLYFNRRGEPILELWQTAVGGPAPAEWQQHVRAVLETGERKELELTCGDRVISFFLTPITEGGYVNLYGRDVTERKRAEQALRQLNLELEQRVADRTAKLEAKTQELEAFAYSVSHDLKAPLRGIDGYSSLLQTGYAAQLDEDGRLFLQNIRQAARNMHQLIDDLLAYSRLERREMTLRPVDLGGLVESLLAEFAPQIEAGAVEVQVQLPCDQIQADFESLGQVLRNLIDNALKFAADARVPRIEIGGRIEPLGCVIWVRDNGIGFDMRHHERIFEIFQRLHRVEEYPGTGIGLAIVRKAMMRMGGRVWAESAAGQGATFYLEFPRR